MFFDFSIFWFEKNLVRKFEVNIFRRKFFSFGLRNDVMKRFFEKFLRLEEEVGFKLFFFICCFLRNYLVIEIGVFRN